MLRGRRNYKPRKSFLKKFKCMIDVIVLDNFKKEIKPLLKKYPSLKNELVALISSLEQNPKQGISLGMDCYKIRIAIASKSSGKSGGARVITCFKILHNSIFLVSIFDKTDADNIEDKRLRFILKQTGLI
jgi:hypothetical protein